MRGEDRSPPFTVAKVLLFAHLPWLSSLPPNAGPQSGAVHLHLMPAKTQPYSSKASASSFGKIVGMVRGFSIWLSHYVCHCSHQQQTDSSSVNSDTSSLSPQHKLAGTGSSTLKAFNCRQGVQCSINQQMTSNCPGDCFSVLSLSLSSLSLLDTSEKVMENC